MKILIIHNFYQQLGGEDVIVREEAALLEQGGENVSLFTAHNNEINSFWRKLRTGLNVVYNPQARRKLSARLKADRPDIVHVHNFFPLLSPSIFFACNKLDIPCVFTLHNYRILCPTCFLFYDGKVQERSLHHSCFWTVYRRVYRRSFVGTLLFALMVEFHKRIGTWQRRVDRYIVLTRFSKTKFVEGGLPPERITIKGHAIAEPMAAEAITSRHGALFVGRLSEEKGLRILLKAWKELDYPLKIIGTGPLSELVTAATGGNVKYLGYLPRSEVHAEMRKASYLIIPSIWYEMFSVVLVEAFACGLPVVVSEWPSLMEIVDVGVTGLSFRIGDADDLAEKASWAIAHPLEMDRFGRNGRKKYEEELSSKANYRNLMEIYQDVISSHKIGR